MSQHTTLLRIAGGLLLCLATAVGPSAFAQGSIFGSVQNADSSVPADSELVFFGFIRDTDAELRTNFVDGADYEEGNWYDDFQNYASEAPGQPYDYFFYNRVRDEFFHLDGLIPNNSFQREDVLLAATVRPDPVAELRAIPIDGVGVQLVWSSGAGSSHHIYRRQGIGNGSFFRIDNPVGDLSDRGVSDTTYLDTGATAAAVYSYVIVAEDDLARYSPPSAVVTIGPECLDGTGNDPDGDGVADLCDNCAGTANPYQADFDDNGIGDACCCTERGDLDNSGALNVGDLTYLVSDLFQGGPGAGCPAHSDINASGDLNIADLTFLVAFLFQGGPTAAPCP